ncbi:MAG: amidase [Gemmatimonadota bacterium]|nr:amidase [Gemmatimonadota bacterium]
MTRPSLLPIEELAPQIERREISPVEVIRDVLDNVERFDGVLATFINVFDDAAIAEAESAADEIVGGRYRGPLHGIPIAIKDSIAVAGAPTTNGSKLWADHVTDFDAAVVERLRGQGAVVVGKNNMHEWGMGGTCTGMHFGTVRNPWDPNRIPGGSSGGSAAAVSAGLATAAIGADGWGSIRTPASYCGVVGLMPTQGLVSRFGELPPTSSWHHTIGPITRTVRDAAIVLDAIAGHDARDPTSVPDDRATAASDGIDEGVAGLRVGVPTSYFWDDAVPAVRAALDAARATFQAMGASVSAIDLPRLHDLPLALAAAQHESQAVLLPLALDHPEGFASAAVRLRVLAGEFLRAADRRRGMQIRNRMRAEVLDAFSTVDVILTPSNSTVAFPVDADRVAVGSDDEEVDLGTLYGQSRLTTRLTLPWNLVGVPAVSLPSGATSDGLPIGIQLAAAPMHEAALLRAARAYEAETGGYRVPPLVAETTPEGGAR